MKAVVIDTSALVRLYVPDGPLPSGLEATIDAAAQGEVVLLVPELALVEAVQVLRRKEEQGFLAPEETDEILGRLLALPLEVVGHRDLLWSALAVARDQGLTAYDALFLALARERRARLLTADQALADAEAALDVATE